jgi:hypothetical protein
MAHKNFNLRRTNVAFSASGHGNFKHTAKGADLKTVLAAYGLKRSDYIRIRDLVVSHLPKKSANGR